MKAWETWFDTERSQNPAWLVNSLTRDCGSFALFMKIDY
jgi:hypothetical protein